MYGVHCTIQPGCYLFIQSINLKVDWLSLKLQNKFIFLLENTLIQKFNKNVIEKHIIISTYFWA